MITGVRTIELRAALWSEFDLDNAIWEIPAERMKMRRAHLVPLSTQALDLLNELKIMSGTIVMFSRMERSEETYERSKY
jgi:integrase